jgi:pathogenesis-related protein 1
MPSARRTPLLVLALLAIGCATPDQPSATPTASATPAATPSRSRPPARERQPTAPDPGESPATNDPFAEGFVAAHDQVRARVSAEPRLPAIQWSPELAADATAWARRCTFEHSSTDYGENLSARTDRADPAAIVAAWAAEAEHFDHRRNRCASGEICGHYTQVVWRGTTKIGCGIAQCEGGGPFGGGQWFMWVCNYDPPGNWKGERPY